MRISNEIKIGAVVIAAFLITYFGFRFMRDVPLLGESNEVEVVYDRVDGLSAGSIVYLKGVKIGSVKSLELTPDDSIRAVLSIEGDRRFPKGSVARISAASLVDGKAVYVEKSDSPEWVERNGRLVGVYDVSILETFSEQKDDLTQGVGGTVLGVEELVARMNLLLDEPNRERMGGALEDLERTMAETAELVEGSRQEIQETIDAAQRAMRQLDTLATDNRPRVDSLMTELDSAVESLTRTSAELESTLTTLNAILVKVDGGEGSAGLLVNDPSLYRNLDSLSVELTELTRGLNEDPKRYLKHLKLFSLF